jgi:hypothetical protein
MNGIGGTLENKVEVADDQPMVDRGQQLLDRFERIPHRSFKIRELAMADAYRDIIKRDELILDRMHKSNEWQVVSVAEHIAIVCRKNKDVSPYPFSGLALKHGQWEDTCHIYANFEQALLGTIGYYYEGSNGQFCYYATKMLGIEIK